MTTWQWIWTKVADTHICVFIKGDKNNSGVGGVGGDDDDDDGGGGSLYVCCGNARILNEGSKM